MVVGCVRWVFTASFRPLLCSVAHAAALKHSFECDMTWGYNGAIDSSAAIFIQEQECVDLNCLILISCLSEMGPNLIYSIILTVRGPKSQLAVLQ